MGPTSVLVVAALLVLGGCGADAAFCSASFSLSTPWASGTGTSLVSVTVSISSGINQIVQVPWTLSVSSPTYKSVQQTFNLGAANVSSGVISAATSAAWQTLVPNGSPASAGMIVEITSGTGAPSAIQVNGQACSVAGLVPAPPPPPASGGVEGITAGMTTKDGQLVGPNGKALFFHGINWFGFDDGNTMVDGLWEGSTSLTQDLAGIVYRMQMLGFNAVRLPFSFKDFGKVPNAISYGCSQLPWSNIAASAIQPGANVRGTAAKPKAPPSQVPGVCNSYVPSNSVIDRFLYVVNYMTQQGMYVVMDNQLNLDRSALDNPNSWASQWASLVQTLTNRYPKAATMVLLDLLNEPDSQYLAWDWGWNTPGATELYLKGMDAIAAVNPSVIFLVEGCGQNALGKNWGDGLATDPAIVQQRGINSAASLFSQLMRRSYLNQVVVAPHVYPPSISSAREETTGSSLFYRLSAAHGYLNKQGYCTGSNTLGRPSGTCHKFPVIIGETGTNFQDSRDNQAMKDNAQYWLNTGAAKDGLHNKVNGYFFWAWNANSGDTHGIVGDDWATLRWDKLNYLATLGQYPWYGSSGARSESYDYEDGEGPPTPPSLPANVSYPPPVVYASNPPAFPLYSQAVLGSTYSASTAAPPPPAIAGGSIESDGGASSLAVMTTNNQGQILGVDGLALNVKGITWGGFDTSTFLADLNVGGTTLSGDFAVGVQKLLALGFNTVKLPFSFNILNTAQPANVTSACQASNATAIQAALTPGGFRVYNGTAVPDLTAAPSGKAGTCNAYIPSASTLARFQYVVDFLASNGLYVVLENRFEVDRSALANPQTWINSWASLVTKLSANTQTARRLMITPISNPDSANMTWAASAGFPGLASLYSALLDTLDPINPGLLFLLEGTGQLALSQSGGAGFASDLATIAAYNLSDPTSFFKQLLFKSYVNQVVIAPRLTPPSVTGIKANTTGAGLFSRLSSSFGYLNKQGYCINPQQCKTFPVLLGDFGSPLRAAEDTAFLNDLAAYLQLGGSGNDGQHAFIPGFIWNGYNNGTLGGILESASHAINFDTVAYLELLGLSPWYLPPTVHKARPVLPGSLPSTLNVTTFCSATAAAALSGYINGTNTTLAALTVTLKNTGDVAIMVPWTLGVTSTSYTGVENVFGLAEPGFDYTTGTVSATAGNFWDLLWPQGTNSVSLGLVVSSLTQNIAPQQISINGVACTLLPSSPSTAGAGAESEGDDVIRVSSNQPGTSVFVAPSTGTTN